jgi:DnaJ-class molecular chaperone
MGRDDDDDDDDMPHSSSSSRNYNYNSNSNSNYNRNSHANSRDPSSPQYYEGQNNWQILGVPEGSDKSTIKKAYIKLLRQWHPDKVEDPSNEQNVKEAHKRTQKINQAYESLTKNAGGKSRKHHKKRQTRKNKR